MDKPPQSLLPCNRQFLNPHAGAKASADQFQFWLDVDNGLEQLPKVARNRGGFDTGALAVADQPAVKRQREGTLERLYASMEGVQVVNKHNVIRRVEVKG